MFCLSTLGVGNGITKGMPRNPLNTPGRPREAPQVGSAPEPRLPNQGHPLERNVEAANDRARQEGWRFGPSALSELRAIASELSPSLRDPTIPRASRDPGDLLEGYLLSGIKLDPLPSAGRPIGSFGLRASLNCVHDEGRTKAFLTGIESAVEQLSRIRSEITVVDAGCGTLPLLGLYAALLSEKVRVTAIELNPAAVEIARATVKKFGLENRMKVIEADAVRFEPDRRTDLLLSETMATALSGESLPEILAQQTKFLSRGARVLPSGITIRGGMVLASDFLTPHEEILIGKSIVPKYSPRWSGEFRYKSGEVISEIALEISTAGLQPGVYFPVVCSEVHLGRRSIRPWDSLISLPAIVAEDPSGDSILLHLKPDGARPVLEVRYPPGKFPRAVIR